MNPVALVTGAGSGVGRAVALSLNREGWTVVVSGRTEERLQATARACVHPGQCHVRPLTLGDPSHSRSAVGEVMARFGRIDLLVNAAGTNVPQRSLEVLSELDYAAIMEANLHGAFHLIQAVLPIMREQARGTIVNVASDAARQASAKAGPAYVMSKFGLLGLTQAINAEERAHGVRACAILPGDIDTPLLDKRPNPPPPEARAKMLQPEDVAACVLLAVNLPDRAVVEELLIRPRV